MTEKLLIYKEDKDKFSIEILEEKLTTVDGVSNLSEKKSTDCALCLDFVYEQYPVAVRLADDLETVIVDSLSDTSLLFALKLQEIEKVPLRMFNDNYDFHFSMRGIRSLKKLKKKIQEHFFDEEAVALETALI